MRYFSLSFLSLSNPRPVSTMMVNANLDFVQYNDVAELSQWQHRSQTLLNSPTCGQKHKYQTSNPLEKIHKSRP